MRKFFKYLFRTLGVLVALILLLVSLLYIPAVQRYIKNRVVEYAASHWDMTVGIGELSLKFPVDLSLERVYAGKTNTDTLAYLGRLRLDAGIGRLMWGQIAVDDLQLEDVVLNLRNDTTGMVLKVRTIGSGCRRMWLACGRNVWISAVFCVPEGMCFLRPA
ncbi:hypothetical protein DXA95_01525 [Odoribacter sp. OF09-27XD]|nr:hypothetical protein [Odoribacter sp. OF09-27XD]RHV98382.1 hypothetical protein DXA95_01525 [Odoribacter sp. OF09-27XD]